MEPFLCRDILGLIHMGYELWHVLCYRNLFLHLSMHVLPEFFKTLSNLGPWSTGNHLVVELRGWRGRWGGKAGAEEGAFFLQAQKCEHFFRFYDITTYFLIIEIMINYYKKWTTFRLAWKGNRNHPKFHHQEIKQKTQLH